MRDTLENLYFGNITPNEQDITPGSVLADAIDRAEQCEEKLTTLLEGEEKTLLLQLLNAENEINSTMALENFILGFRLGMRLAIEALDEDDGSLTMTSGILALNSTGRSRLHVPSSLLPTRGRWLEWRIRVCDGVNVSGCRNFAAAVILSVEQIFLTVETESRRPSSSSPAKTRRLPRSSIRSGPLLSLLVVMVSMSITPQ